MPVDEYGRQVGPQPDYGQLLQELARRYQAAAPDDQASRYVRMMHGLEQPSTVPPSPSATPWGVFPGGGIRG